MAYYVEDLLFYVKHHYTADRINGQFMLDNKTSINGLNPGSSLRNQDEHHGAKPDFKIAITNGGLDPKKLKKKQKQNRASKATFSGLQAGRLDVRGRLDLGGHMMGSVKRAPSPIAE